MPTLKNPRWEQYAQILASPHPPQKIVAFAQAGFKPSPAHATRVSQHPLVAARIAELQAKAANLAAMQAARSEAAAVCKIAVSRETLMVDSAAAFKVAEANGNAQGMVAAIRLMAELAQISLKAPDDKQPTQHLHLHEAASLIDRPPTETLEQWIERKRLEAEDRATTRRLKVVKDVAS